MIGRNTLTWNQATMRAAVQYYLDHVVLKNPTLEVESVGTLETFAITVKDRPASKEESK
jgi:hypothetical protein